MRHGSALLEQTLRRHDGSPGALRSHQLFLGRSWIMAAATFTGRWLQNSQRFLAAREY